MTVKVTDTAAYTDKLFKGHGGPILSLSLDPKKEFLASASCDGSVRIWNISTTSQVLGHFRLKLVLEIRPSMIPTFSCYIPVQFSYKNIKIVLILVHLRLVFVKIL